MLKCFTISTSSFGLRISPILVFLESFPSVWHELLLDFEHGDGVCSFFGLFVVVFVVIFGLGGASTTFLCLNQIDEVLLRSRGCGLREWQSKCSN